MSASDSPQDILEGWEEEHTEHADERWLISYADMMTLLFGLFVMLYTMQDRMNEVQDAAKKQFLTKDEKVDADPIMNNPDIFKSRIETLEQQLQALKYQLADANKAKEDVTAKWKSAEQDLESIRYEIQRKNNQLIEVNNEIERQRKEKAEAPSVMPPPIMTIAAGAGSASSGSAPPVAPGGGAGAPASPARPTPVKSHSMYKLSFTLPNGNKFETETNRVGIGGLQLDEPIPTVVAGEQFQGTISKDGESVEVIVKNMVGDDGQASDRYQIIIFPNLDRARLEAMIKKKSPPQP